MKKIALKRILIIAVPIIVSNIISQVQMIIDRAFLGQKDPLYMSALGNVNSPIWTTVTFCFSIVMGASILISQAVGAGETKDTEKYAASMLKWNNVVPILLFFFWTFCAKWVYTAMGVSDNVMPLCLTYTRYFTPIILLAGLEASFSVIVQTSNHTKPLVWFGIIRAGLNIILDWVLIFGHLGFPEMGIKGAAIATTIAEYVGCIYAFLYFIFTKQLSTKPSFKAVLKAPLKPFFTSMKLGIHAAMEEFAWNFGNLMLIRILNTIDEMAAGIYSMIFSVEILVVVVIGAVGNATLTLSGEAKGQKDVKQFKAVAQVAYGISVAVSVLMLVLCMAVPEQMMRIFTRDTGLILLCSTYLIYMCLNLYGKSANIILGNGIRGSGDTKWMFVIQIFGTVFVIGFAAFFVFVLDMGIAGVFFAVIADEIVRALINFAHYRKIVKEFALS